MLYLHRYTWAIIRPQLEQEYGFSNTQLELIFTLFNFSYMIGQVPGGIVSDFFGAHLFLGSIIFIWSVCLILFALVGSFWAFGGIRLLFGAAQAGAYPSLSSISTKWFAPSSRTTFQGFISSFSGRIGGALAPLIMATVLMGHYGYSWRTAVIILASCGIFFAAAFMILFKSSPDVDKRVNKAEQDLIRSGGEPKGKIAWALTPIVLATFCLCLWLFKLNGVTLSLLVVGLVLFFRPSVTAVIQSLFSKSHDDRQLPENREEHTSARPRKQVLKFGQAARHRSYQLLVFQQYANAGGDIVYTSVLGSVFAAKGVTIAEMGVYASLPLFGGAIGGYVGGYLNDIAIRLLKSRRWARSFMGFLGKAIATVCLFLAISQESAESLAWGLFIVKFFSDWSQPTVWGTCSDLGGKNAGTVFSIVNTTGQVGALTIPLVVGPLLDHFSTMQVINGEAVRITDYGPMFVLVAGLYMVSAITWLFINCTKPIEPELETS